MKLLATIQLRLHTTRQHLQLSTLLQDTILQVRLQLRLLLTHPKLLSLLQSNPSLLSHHLMMRKSTSEGIFWSNVIFLSKYTW